MTEQVSGRDIVRALKGFWRGNKGSCRCPAHADRDPSLSVKETPDRVLIHCFGGCPQEVVLDALRAQGLWPDRDEFGIKARPRAPLIAPVKPEIDEDEVAKRNAAREIWRQARPLNPSSAHLYLACRGITGRMPPSLRAVPALYNAERKQPLPALVAAVQDETGWVTAVQRIWVRDKYVSVNGKALTHSMKADVRDAKKTLGPIGAGAVHLGRAGGTLGIAEGIETALSAQKIYSLPVWAALGAWRMGNLAIPKCVSRIVIFADNGDAGFSAADRARASYEAQGYESHIISPPDEFGDFNDWLMAKEFGNDDAKWQRQ